MKKKKSPVILIKRLFSYELFGTLSKFCCFYTTNNILEVKKKKEVGSRKNATETILKSHLSDGKHVDGVNSGGGDCVAVVRHRGGLFDSSASWKPAAVP